jgi:hypothetical protein
MNEVLTVHDAVKIATRRTTVPRKPHAVNPSGIGRNNSTKTVDARCANEIEMNSTVNIQKNALKLPKSL